MAYGPKRSAAAANAACDAMTALVNAGTPPGLLKIYGLGSGVPADVATAITDQPILAELTFNSTAFTASGAQGDGGAGTQPATAGKAWAKAIVGDTSANASGTAVFFRIFNAAGTAIFQGLCGTSVSDLNLNTTAIAAGAAVDITSLSISESLG